MQTPTLSTDAPASAKRASGGKTSRARTAASTKAKARLDAETRRRLIAEAAYYKAEERGFVPGWEESDWFAAEQEIDRQFP